VFSTKTFAEIATVAGHPARAGMLHALLGRAMTASELALVAGIAPQTASGHLARMTAAGLVSVQRQGRHRLHSLASPAVARLMESIMLVAGELEPRGKSASARSGHAALKAARVCYDHLAGELGVALSDALVRSGHIELSAEGGIVTRRGLEFLGRIGIRTEGFLTSAGKPSKRALCRPCVDWTEKRLHLGGSLGAAICGHCFDKGWIRWIGDSRAVTITAPGRQALKEQFGVAPGFIRPH
jgi:DNA-binding transcriptional ArsR family regulator